MRRSRLATSICLLLGVLALALPAGALAGGSAGNQQYTDPFGSKAPSHSTQTATQAPTQTATQAPPPTQTASPAASPTTSPSSGAADPPTTATSAAAPATSGTLPYSGFAVPTAAGLGVVLIATGLTLRRRTGAAR